MTKTRRAGFSKKRRRGGRKTIKRRKTVKRRKTIKRKGGKRKRRCSRGGRWEHSNLSSPNLLMWRKKCKAQINKVYFIYIVLPQKHI